MKDFEARNPSSFWPARTGGGQPPGIRPSWLGVAVAVFVLLSLAGTLRSIYVDVLWFQSVGFEDVFWTRITTQVALFLTGTAAAMVTIGGNVWLAYRLAPRRHEMSFVPELNVRAIRRLSGLALTAAVLLLAALLGSAAGGFWDTVLGWMYGVPFGQADPQFGRDVSFFVFVLPAYRIVHGWLVGLFVASALGAVAVYALTYALQGFSLVVTPGMRIHLSVLGGGLLLLMGVGSYLGAFDLVMSPDGVAYGGMFTDVNARIPVQYVLAFLAALAGAVTIVNVLLTRSGFWLPGVMLGLYAVVFIAGSGIYPAVVQSLQVEPNELRREQPYIQRTVDSTRSAWGLERIEVVEHPANPVVTPAELAANPETLDNIRLLDPQPLTATLNELQALRPLYRFSNIDISRYPLNQEGSADQQVLVSARELDLSRVADRNWTRDRLQLTHGFGAIATPVTEVQAEGLPELVLRDIPPRTEYERLELTEDGSRIYFGELTDHYVVVNSYEPEFDYPDPEAGGQDVQTSYQHDRGILLSSLLRRLLLAWELGDFNLLISQQIHDESRVLMRRQIQERARTVAPFLLLDSDPYVAVIDGALKWIQPAYTYTSRYPYSEPAGGINYLRNSVQIVIDSSTGDMDFYIVDPDDPIVRTFEGVFPGLFTPVDEMPAALQQQLRYPLDMFRIQAQLYRRYHVTSAETFFLGEDFWEIPIQRARSATGPMEPYYVTMRLPGEAAVEFVLIMPFTPRDRENTVAWLAGRSDGAQFSTLRNFRFPTGVLVFGPSQVENRIEQNATISQQLTLWDSAGSEVLRSTLMMIPIGDSFLYVQPVYLQATGGRMPELRRVIVANGNIVSMEETFDEAVQVAVSQRAPSAPEFDLAERPGEPDSTPVASRPAGPTDDLPQLLERARQSSDATQAELDRLRSLLDQIEEALER